MLPFTPPPAVAGTWGETRADWLAPRFRWGPERDSNVRPAAEEAPARQESCHRGVDMGGQSPLYG